MQEEKKIVNNENNHKSQAKPQWNTSCEKKNTQRKIIPSSADGSKKLNNKYFLKGN